MAKAFKMSGAISTVAAAGNGVAVDEGGASERERLELVVAGVGAEGVEVEGESVEVGSDVPRSWSRVCPVVCRIACSARARRVSSWWMRSCAAFNELVEVEVDIVRDVRAVR